MTNERKKIFEKNNKTKETKRQRERKKKNLSSSSHISMTLSKQEMHIVGLIVDSISNYFSTREETKKICNCKKKLK